MGCSTVYVKKKPIAWKVCCVVYWCGKTRKHISMVNVTSMAQIRMDFIFSLTKLFSITRWCVMHITKPHTIILYNKMMCYAQHQVTYSKVQGHSVRPQFHNRAESTTCWNAFWYFYTQLFSITRCYKVSGFSDMSGLGCICNILKLNLILLTHLLSLAIWCVMHNTQSPTLKFIVTVWAQTVTVRNFMSGLKLPHAGIDFDIFTTNYSP